MKDGKVAGTRGEPSTGASAFLVPFLKSVLAGALTSAAPLMLMTLPLGIMTLPGIDPRNGDVWKAVRLMFLPLAVSLPVAFVGALLIGLPVAMAMRRRGLESEMAYTFAGGAAGALVALPLVLVAGGGGGFVFVSLGTIAGLATGYTWWRTACRPWRSPEAGKASR